MGSQAAMCSLRRKCPSVALTLLRSIVPSPIVDRMSASRVGVDAVAKTTCMQANPSLHDVDGLEGIAWSCSRRSGGVPSIVF